MFGSILLYFGVLCGLFLLNRIVPQLEQFVSNSGWFIIIVYLAYVLTRWIRNNLPRQIIDATNKAVLITGCDSGFGHKLASRLDALGFHVYAGCLFPEGKGAKTLKEKCSERLCILAIDVTKDDEVQAAVKTVETTLDGKELWAVVSNAGVAVFAELEWSNMSTIEYIFDVNVMGTVRVAKAFLPMLRSFKGRVIIVSSVAGHFTYPGFVTYSMTKHSLSSFADGLRREMKKWGIRVSTIEPSLYRTQISAVDALTCSLEKSWRSTSEEVREDYGQQYFLDFKRKMSILLQEARPNIWEVVDCMEHAIIHKNPKLVYRCGGPSDKFRQWLMSLMPTVVLDFLMCKVVQPSRNISIQDAKKDS